MPMRSRQKSWVPSCARDVAQAVVARDAAAELHLRLAGQEIELVVDDQDFLRRDREEARQRGDRPARQVHVRHRASASAGRRRPWRRGPGTSPSLRNVAPSFAASASTNQNPALWRVSAYSRSGIAEPGDETDRRHAVSAAHWRGCSDEVRHRLSTLRAAAAQRKRPAGMRAAGPVPDAATVCAYFFFRRPCRRIPSCRRPSRRPPSRRRGLAAGTGARAGGSRCGGCGGFGFGGSGFGDFLDLRLRHDGGGDHRIELAARHHGDARRELQRRDVHRMADVERRQVDGDEFRADPSAGRRCRAR